MREEARAEDQITLGQADEAEAVVVLREVNPGSVSCAGVRRVPATGYQRLDGFEQQATS